MSEDERTGLEEITSEPADSSAGVMILGESQSLESLEEETGEPVEVVTFDFVEAFLEQVERLAHHPKVTRHAREMDMPTPDITMVMIEDGLGGELAEDLKSLYKLSNLFRLQWHFEHEGSERLGGSLNIINFARVFGRWLEELWRDDESLSDAERDFSWTLRGFDVPGTPEALWGVLSLDSDDPSRYSIWTRHPEHGVLRMHLGLVDYIYCALGALGSPCWQLLFTDYDFQQNPWGVAAPESWIHRLELFFPELDTRFFREHWAHKTQLPRPHEEE